MKKQFLTLGMATSTAIAFASGFLPKNAIAASFTGLNVFGDSSADSGNFFNVTSAFSSLGAPAVPPSPPYAQRHSNGPIWMNQLWETLGLFPTLSSELALNSKAPLRLRASTLPSPGHSPLSNYSRLSVCKRFGPGRTQ